MNLDQLWAEYVRQNPSLGGAEEVVVHTSIRNIRKLVRVTWEAAQDSMDDYFEDEQKPASSSAQDDVMNAFRSIFNKERP